MNQNKKAFTLIEIVVAITILVVLSVIGMMTLQSHQKDARDSVRISDVELINRAMDVYYVDYRNYPEPSDYTSIAFTWTELWQQGTVWKSVIINLKSLSKELSDPLKGTEYTYSRLNTKEQYQIATILEGTLLNNIIPTNTANAENSVWVDDWVAYIDGKYNWLVGSIQKWWEVIAVALPSIITSDLSNTDYEDIIANNSLLYNWEWFN